MKQQLQRSTINNSIDRAKNIFSHFGIHLPPYAFWSLSEWEKAGEDIHEIRECMLGWDVTDFGSQRFFEIGRTLFTLRNGKLKSQNYRKTYAEKLIIDPEGQRAPAHFHRSKREDIINRAGGNILVQLTATTPHGEASTQNFDIFVDGIQKKISPREIIRLKPGQSLCIPPRTIHQFWGEEGTGYQMDGIGYSVSGEVSSVCDDLNDNVFLEKSERFPRILEDEPRRYYLCNEYPKSSTSSITQTDTIPLATSLGM
ncbi:MAG: D-lyxose/D-mannose family sugar isomerase [Verrucomicrobiota bacterium]